MRDDYIFKNYIFIDAFTLDSEAHNSKNKYVNYIHESGHHQLKSVSENKVRKGLEFLLSYGSFVIEILSYVDLQWNAVHYNFQISQNTIYSRICGKELTHNTSPAEKIQSFGIFVPTSLWICQVYDSNPK